MLVKKISKFHPNLVQFDKLFKMWCLVRYVVLNQFPTDNFKKYTKKIYPKITILEILVYKIQPEIMKSKIFTRFNFITKPCSQE